MVKNIKKSEKNLWIFKKNYYIVVLLIFVGISILSCNKNNNNDSITDFDPPVITILGDDPDYTEKDSIYIDPGATAWDAVDGDISSNIITTNNVNIYIVGKYTVNYMVGDRAGNIADTFRIVNVQVFK